MSYSNPSNPPKIPLLFLHSRKPRGNYFNSKEKICTGCTRIAENQPQVEKKEGPYRVSFVQEELCNLYPSLQDKHKYQTV